jgi:2-methylcitrate dehydratase PrpD
MAVNMGHRYTSRIIDHVMEFNFEDIPCDVVEHSKIIILDTLGAILAASNPRYPSSRIITDFVREQGCNEESTVVGRDFKTSSVNAALANATMGYMCDIEPHHVKAVLHEAAVLLPSAIAVGEMVGASGRDVIEAFVLGADIETRVALAVSPTGMYARGFHPTVVAGCFGSAVSAGKILGLDHSESLNAFGLAGAQSSGLLAWESDKTEMSRPFNPGIAARNGVTAALLANKGFAGPEVLEGKYSVFKAFSGESHLGELLDGLGSRFEVMNFTFKRYSSCSFTHPGLDALLKMMHEADIEVEEIEWIEVSFPTSGANLIDGSELKSHNIQYILSVGANRKQVTIDDILFEQDDERIWDLSKRVKLIHDDELDRVFPTRMPTIVKLRTRDGRTFEERVDSAKGTPENPITYEEIKQKFTRLAKMSIGEELSKEIMGKVEDLNEINNINELTELLRFKQ